jgi:hypothetical protein
MIQNWSSWSKWQRTVIILLAFLTVKIYKITSSSVLYSHKIWSRKLTVLVFLIYEVFLMQRFPNCGACPLGRAVGPLWGEVLVVCMGDIFILTKIWGQDKCIFGRQFVICLVEILCISLSVCNGTGFRL